MNLLTLLPFIIVIVSMSSCTNGFIKRNISSLEEYTTDTLCTEIKNQYKTLGSPTKMLLVQTHSSGDSNSWSAFNAKAQLMEKNASGHWEEVGEKFPMVVGKNGLALGDKVSQFASVLSAPIKKEGDGKTPLGLHLFGKKFGFEREYDNDSYYRQITSSTHCVDDVKSKHYNKVVDLGSNKSIIADWNSSEKMSSVKLYELGAEINYKSNAEKVAGSCIFLHLWRDSNKGTAGCIATSKPNVESILNFAKDDTPVVTAVFTRAIYTQIAGCF